MITQKDVHNILVKQDIIAKAELLKLHGGDVEKIKEFENLFAKCANIVLERSEKAWDYLNEELK